MASTVKLSDTLVEQARRYGEVYHRSIPKQIEYWSHIGRIAEENPELSYGFICEILKAKLESQEGDVTPYQFG